MEEREDTPYREQAESSDEPTEAAHREGMTETDTGTSKGEDRTSREERETGGESAGPTSEASAESGQRDDREADRDDEEDREAAAGELFASGEEVDFRARWEVIQTGFVDEPRRSVQEADALVGDLMKRLLATFSGERERLENQWDRGDEVSTEELRHVLRRYRTFFNRLLEA
jgi:hypothetical protein